MALYSLANYRLEYIVVEFVPFYAFRRVALKQRLEQLDPPVKSGCPRIVVHHQIGPEAAKAIVDTVKQMKLEVEQNGQAIATNGQVKGSVYGK